VLVRSVLALFRVCGPVLRWRGWVLDIQRWWGFVWLKAVTHRNFMGGAGHEIWLMVGWFHLCHLFFGGSRRGPVLDFFEDVFINYNRCSASFSSPPHFFAPLAQAYIYIN
jgi:hypothetical protein